MMCLLYMVVKYTLCYIVIAFRDSGDVVRNIISYTYHIIAIYNSIPLLYSFLICLYDTYYAASLMIDIRLVL